MTQEQPRAIGFGYVNPELITVLIDRERFRFCPYGGSTQETERADQLRRLQDFLTNNETQYYKVVLVETLQDYHELLNNGVDLSMVSCVCIFDTADTLAQAGIPLMDVKRDPCASNAWTIMRVVPPELHAALTGETVPATTPAAAPAPEPQAPVPTEDAGAPVPAAPAPQPAAPAPAPAPAPQAVAPAPVEAPTPQPPASAPVEAPTVPPPPMETPPAPVAPPAPPAPPQAPAVAQVPPVQPETLNVAQAPAQAPSQPPVPSPVPPAPVAPPPAPAAVAPVVPPVASAPVPEAPVPTPPVAAAPVPEAPVPAPPAPVSPAPVAAPAEAPPVPPVPASAPAEPVPAPPPSVEPTETSSVPSAPAPETSAVAPVPEEAPATSHTQATAGATDDWEGAWDTITHIGSYLEYWAAAIPGQQGVTDPEVQMGTPQCNDLFYRLRLAAEEGSLGRDAIWEVHQTSALFAGDVLRRQEAVAKLEAADSWIPGVEEVFNYLKKSEWGKAAREAAYLYLEKKQPLDEAIATVGCWAPDAYYLVLALHDLPGVKFKFKKRKKK